MIPILFALLLIGILLLVIIAGRPDEFSVTRSGKIAAPPEQIFPHVNELKKWDAWSPWAKLDPNCKITFTGPDAGVDSSYAWAGNNKVGEGKMTVIESVPSSLIRLRLEFLKPFKATNTAEFKFTSEGGQTLVMWSMAGKNSVFSKVFSLFVDCEKMIGKDYDKGLASLKSVVEAGK
ncbi:MAG: SRPBCC family protein [Verrucomicrobiota bacterium]